MPAPSDVPLRPMTLGELLDAAMSLLRQRALPLLGLAASLAVAEQALLAPLRAAAGLRAPFYGPADGFGDWWLVTSVGFATEAAVITVLGGYAAAAAGPALLGLPVTHRALWRRVRPGATLTAAVLVGAAAGAGAALGFVPWLFVQALLGLTAPALVLDRVRGPFTALGRSAALSVRSGMRAGWIRLAGYLTWLSVRFAVGAGWTAVASPLTGERPGWQPWVVAVAWLLADVLAYSALACLDAVLHVETRIRTEGLDIAVNRVRSRGGDGAGALVYVP
jgi:hypothetical protein